MSDKVAVVMPLTGVTTIMVSPASDSDQEAVELAIKKAIATGRCNPIARHKQPGVVADQLRLMECGKKDSPYGVFRRVPKRRAHVA